MRRDVAGRTDITPKAQEQYAWAISHIEARLGAIQLSMLDRDDVAGWIGGPGGLPVGGSRGWGRV